MDFDNALFAFTFYYPLFMAYVWMIGGVAYYYRYERASLRHGSALASLTAYPPVSILVPCFNESDNIREVVESLCRISYPDYEIICINDGSTDNTGAILDQLADEYSLLRVVHQAANQGKAVALNTAALVARSEFLMCIDADSVLEPDAVALLLQHFETGPRLGAVTGNPRIRTRSTLLGRLQVGEFSSIIGLIKRTQRVYGRLFTASGVVTMFRRRALLQCGFWSPDMLTEDIDISWKLQSNHWDVRFEPRALCWILMPETIAGLWKQRLRWAMGGIQTIMKYAYLLKRWRFRRMWLIYAEYVASVIWAYSMGAVLLLWVAGLFISVPLHWQVRALPSWHGVLIGTTCLLQVLIGSLLDRRYDTHILRHYFYMIWYPIAYWMLNMCTTIASVPATLMRREGRRAVWISPDRGIGAPQQALVEGAPRPAEIVEEIKQERTGS